MNLVVVLLGLLIGGVGLLGIAQPQTLIAWMLSFWRKDRLWVAVILRLALGALLIYAAPECRFPLVIRILGGITVFAAVGVAVAGSERVDSLVRWWTELPLPIVRIWCIGGVLFGVFLAYAGGAPQ